MHLSIIAAYEWAKWSVKRHHPMAVMSVSSFQLIGHILYLIRENTKFWDASGLKASLGFLFVKVPTETLESLVRGGLAFATPDNRDMGAPTALEAYRFLGDGKEGKGRVRGEDSLLERVTAAAEERQLSPNSPGLGGPGLKSSRGRGPKASPSKPSRQKGWGSSMRRRPVAEAPPITSRSKRRSRSSITSSALTPTAGRCRMKEVCCCIASIRCEPVCWRVSMGSGIRV